MTKETLKVVALFVFVCMFTNATMAQTYRQKTNGGDVRYKAAGGEGQRVFKREMPRAAGGEGQRVFKREMPRAAGGEGQRVFKREKRQSQHAGNYNYSEVQTDKEYLVMMKKECEYTQGVYEVNGHIDCGHPYVVNDPNAKRIDVNKRVREIETQASNREDQRLKKLEMAKKRKHEEVKARVEEKRAAAKALSDQKRMKAEKKRQEMLAKRKEKRAAAHAKRVREMKERNAKRYKEAGDRMSIEKLVGSRGFGSPARSKTHKERVGP